MNIFSQLVWAYIKIGIFGFGGGYAMLSLVEKSVVTPGWISETMFTDIVAISQMTPGPIGINSATYIGYVAPGNINPAFASPIWGILGSILATLAVVVPSFLLVSYASHVIAKHKDTDSVKYIFRGLRPVVVGLIASAAIMLMNKPNFCPDGEKQQLIYSIIISVVAFCLVFFSIPIRQKKIKMHPILVIILAGVAGYILYS